MGTNLDLDAYLMRVGYRGSRRPTAAVLSDLHFAHTTAIPFENLDIWLGRPILLDLASLQAKLVHGRRGGYCFEQNSLFAAVLRQLGFTVIILAGRVRWYTTRLLPRTHVLLAVSAGERAWLADVGFGTAGLLRPIPMEPELVHRQSVWSYRLVLASGLWVLQTLRPEGWQDLYAFSLEPQEPPDLEVGNWYTSTHPDSRFVQRLIAQRSSNEFRTMLRDRELIEDRGQGEVVRLLGDDEDLVGVLADRFGLHFPAGTRFRPPAAATPS